MPAWDTSRTGSPRAEVETEFGLATITFFNGDQASVITGSDDYGRDDTFEYRGKHYRGRAGIYGLAGHTCDYREREGAEVCGRTGLHDHGSSYARVDGPPSYAGKMLAELYDAVRTFVAANPGVLLAAERNRLTHDLADASKDEANAYDAYVSANHNVTAIRDRLASLPSGKASA
jgi:hypothetical protein